MALCRKAGKLVIGYELTAEAVSKKDVLVVYASDISQRTYRNTLKLAEKGAVVLGINEKMEDIEQAVGKKFGVAGITDAGLAQLVQSKIEC